jgi:hypothetical protein
MRFARWPLLFLTVYGLLWAHAKITRPSSRAPATAPTGNDDPLPLPEVGEPEQAPVLSRLVDENPSSKESLAYALTQMSDATTPASENPSNVDAEVEDAVARIRAMKNDPDRLQTFVQEELRHLGPDQVVERSVLLREAYLSFDNDFSPQMGNLLEEEREWVANNVAEIRETAAVQGYVQEISRFSIQNCANSAQRKTILADMIHKLSDNPEALGALRTSILQYAEWDLPELTQMAPPEAIPYLRGQKQ